VTAAVRQRSHAAEAGLVSLCGLCCVCVAVAAARVDDANLHRRAQLRLLAEQIASPELAPDGPIAALDGLYERPLQRIASLGGPMIAFVPLPSGDHP
jgi:hypothetical protein